MVKTIDLCGLGNSLVDIQVNTEDSVIAGLGITKGEMRLTDFETQKKFLDIANNSNVNLCSGGSAANSIIAFAKFGGKAAYISVLGNDGYGRFYADEFSKLGINLKAEFLDGDPTGTCLVLITPDSERTMCTSLGATGKFSASNLDEDLIISSKWIYIEGYKFSAKQSTDAILTALCIAENNGTKVALTFSDVFITSQFRQTLRDVALRSDLLFCNENEALSFTETNNLSDALNELKQLNNNFVVTLGERGAMVWWKNKMIEIPAYKTVPVDSTGAGDIFAGAFLYGILYYDSPVLAGHLGSLSASRIVSKPGARLDDDYSELIRIVKDKIKIDN